MNTSAFFLSLATARWFASSIDWLVAFFITGVAFASVLSPGTIFKYCNFCSLILRSFFGLPVSSQKSSLNAIIRWYGVFNLDVAKRTYCCLIAKMDTIL